MISGPPTNVFSTHGDTHLPDPKTIKGITWKEAGQSTTFASLLGGIM